MDGQDQSTTHDAMDAETLAAAKAEMCPRQWVACKFSPADRRSYSYHNDGPPLIVGDKVEVESRGGKRAKVEVVELLDKAPPFATKPILGKATLV